MGIMISWFWLVELFLGIISCIVLIKAFRNKFKSIFWNILLVVVFILIIFNPIKINGTNSDKITTIQNYTIQSNKVLPKKIIDNSFKKGTKQATKDITHDEIWKK